MHTPETNNNKNKSTYTRVSQYRKQTLIELKRKIDKFTVIDGDFNTPLSATDRNARRKISKYFKELNNTSTHRIELIC